MSSGVVGLKLIIGQVAVLVDLVKPSLVTRQESFIIFKNFLLMCFESLGS